MYVCVYTHICIYLGINIIKMIVKLEADEIIKPYTTVRKKERGQRTEP